MHRLQTHIEIEKPIEAVFSLLRDVTNYPRHFHYVESVSILSESDHKLIAEITEAIYGLRQRALARFQFDPPYRVSIEQISGPLESAFAEFRLVPMGDKTRLHHTIEFGVNSSVLRGLFQTAVRAMLEARMQEEVSAIKCAVESKQP